MEDNNKARPKFRTIFIERKAPQDKKISELKEWCSKFHTTGLAPSYGAGSFGNLSFRTKNGFIITACALELKDKLTDDSFTEVISVDMDNRTVTAIGQKEPSSESMLHSAIYRKRKDVNAIFHGHSSNILSRSDELGIISTKKEEASGSGELVKSVLSVLNNDESFIVLKNHGFISLGKNMSEAGEKALHRLTQAS